MSEIAEQVVMDYPEVSDSRYVARPVKDFLFLWEEKGSEKNAITIEKVEAFSGQKTPVSEPPSKIRPSIKETINSFQNASIRFKNFESFG